jgi:hypothetical protein
VPSGWEVTENSTFQEHPMNSRIGLAILYWVATHNRENMWKLSLGVVVLATLFCIGVAHVIYPDRFIEGSGVRKGGGMLTEVNRIGFQIVGIIVAVFAAFLLYLLVGGIFGK